MASNPKSRLGRGLDSLIASGSKPEARPAPVRTPLPEPSTPAEPIGASYTVKSGEGLLEIPISAIDPSPYQARRNIDAESLAELVESIRSVGLLQPILVRRQGDRYQLLAGERRWRACQQLQLKKILARVTEASDPHAAIVGLIENLQRQDLNPIEEAAGFASLMRDFDLTQDAVAERVGKSRPSIANSLRLLQLESEIQGFVAKNLLSVGHAKVLLGLEAGDERVLVARRVLERSLSVRELEVLVAKAKQHKSNRSQSRSSAEAEEIAIRDLERRIASKLSTKVVLQHTPKKGKIIIEYYGNEDMQRILEKLGL